MIPRRIGILGGMGPAATVLLMQRLLSAVPAQDDADHIPLLVDQNPQVPSRIARLIEGRGEDPAPVLIEMAKRLEQAGAQALAMSCNTAHRYADRIQGSVDIPLLDMIELAAARAAAIATETASIGILASPAVKKIALYEPALAAHGCHAIYPEENDSLLDVIRQVKAEGPSDKPKSRFETISTALASSGARVQIIACTEFSLIADAANRHATAIDALDCLVDGVIEFAFSGDAKGPTAAPTPPDRSIDP